MKVRGNCCDIREDCYVIPQLIILIMILLLPFNGFALLDALQLQNALQKMISNCCNENNIKLSDI